MSKLRESARGRECQIRIPGVCNGNPETTVLCHWNGAGIAIKAPDLIGAHGCFSCHQVVDNPSEYCRVHKISSETIKLWFAEGIFRTQELLLKEGLVHC